MARDYSFGDFHFDATTRQLSRDGRSITIGGRAAQLLVLLLRRRGEIVGKDALIAAAWGDRAIEESNLSVQISVLRRIVGEARIRTVERVGYQWIDPELPAAPTPVASRQMAMPAVAVLAFSGDAESAGLGQALADEVTAALVPFRTLNVTAGAPDARFLVRGSVRRAAGRTIATARLFDTLTGSHIWSRSFEGEAGLEVSGAIAAAVESRVHLAELRQQTRRPARNAEAYGLYLEGRARQLSSEVGDNAQAYGFHSAALEVDPDNPLIVAAAAEALHHRAASGWKPVSDSDKALARRLVIRATEVQDLDGASVGLLGNTAMTSGEEDLGLALCRRGAALNPNSPLALVCAGLAEMWADNLDAAETLLLRATTLNPDDPTIRFGLAMRGCLALFRGEPDRALELGHRALSIAPALSGGHWSVIHAHDMLGHRDKARQAFERYRRFAPDVSIARIEAGQPYARPERLAGLIGAMRRVGMPER